MEEILLFLRRLKNDIVNKIDGLNSNLDVPVSSRLPATIRPFTVDLGASEPIKAGDPVLMGGADLKSVWHPAAISGAFDVVKLDDTRSLAFYQDNADALHAKIVTIDVNGVSTTTPVLIDSAVSEFSATLVNTDKVVLITSDKNAFRTGHARVVTTVNNAIVTNAKTVFNNSTGNTFTDGSHLVKVATDKAMVTYKVKPTTSSTTPTNVSANVLTVSGTAVSAGTVLVVHTVLGNGAVRACALDAGRVLVTFDTNSSSTTTGVILSISGSTITRGSYATFARTANNKELVLAAPDVVIFANTQAGDYRMEITLLLISGSSITEGPTSNIPFTGSISPPAMLAMGGNKVALAYGLGAERMLHLRELTVVGSTIMIGEDTILAKDVIGFWPQIRHLNGEAVVFYSNDLDGSFGFLVFVEPKPMSITGSTLENYDGIAKDSGDAGDVIDVYIPLANKRV